MVTLSKPILFRRHETLQNEVKSLDEKQNKARTKPKKKVDEFHPNRKQNLAESDRASCFNQLSESEAACASSLDVSTVSKKKSKETVNKSWMHYVSMAFEDNLNKNHQKETFLHLTA